MIESNKKSQQPSASNEPELALFFRLDSYVFGTPLGKVREVIPVGACTRLPNTVPCFLGMMNIRGEAVGILDLRLRFGLPSQLGPKCLIIVFETDAGPFGSLVDEVVEVAEIAVQSDQRSSYVPIIPEDYVLQVTVRDEKPTTIIDLRRVLSSEELRALRTNAA
ncbi:MAG TPA: chemotaxis protein CheW [Oligoflexus sp.]|uniref:chemotaxis protein CheW n=1 Tax=Oligoflexus sp. TaxID=1971216 RepID=UPI002D3FCE1D|nr:chemotaxis protein CheW [Oligoflexus sp.]HYX39848.1 chemotaxis protein CheW [Oligoflexus sp.]